MKISVRLSLYTGSIVAALMGVVLLLVVSAGRRALLDQATEANANNVRMYAGAVESYLGGAQSTLELAADLWAQAVPASPGLHWLRGASHDVAGSVLAHSGRFEYVLILDPDGEAVHFGPHDLRLSRNDFAFFAWYRDLKEGRRTAVSELHISPATRRPTVVVATRLEGPEGEMIGILAGGLNLAEFSRIGLEEPEGRSLGRYGYLTDRRGLMIAHQAIPRYVEEQTDFSTVLPVREALAGNRGSMLHVDAIEGVEKVGAYLPVAGIGWAAVYEAESRVLLGPLRGLTRSILLIAGLGAMALTALFYLAVIRQITLPLRRLQAATARVAAGDYTGRVELGRRDEIGRLALDFDRMSATVAERTADLEAFNRSVAHDLRAPLRSINGFSQALLEDYRQVLDEQGREHLVRVGAASRRMGELIDGLLDFSKVSRAQLRRGDVDMSALADEIARRLGDTRPDRAVEIRIAPSQVAGGDPVLLRVVLENLLGNAWKFTDKTEQAIIEFRGLVVGGNQAWLVRDNGAGFDMRYRDKLFVPFQRLHSSQEFPGSGIGLATAERIVRRHGGRMWAEGEVGRGATFYFTLQGGRS